MGLQRRARLGEAPRKDLAMVNADTSDMEVRDYSRVAQTLIAIQLRILDEEMKGCGDEPDTGLRASLN
jgi:hypothetical protein